MQFLRRAGLALVFAIPLALLAGFLPQTTQAQTATLQEAGKPVSTASNLQPQQAYSLPPQKLAKAIQLNRIRNILAIGGSLWSLAVLWLLLATRTASGLEARAERICKQRWLQGLLFFAGLLVILTLADLPLSLYGEHVSRIYGISVQSWASWCGDLAKGLGLSLLLGAPLMLFFHWIVRIAPRRFWLWAWIASMPLMVLGTVATPFLEPVFNEFEPLGRNHADLVTQLEKVVARTGTEIPVNRMFLMKASLKSNGLNAYVSGMGATKRIVVWDTTAGRIPDDEILFIFGHESGHYVLHHIGKELAGSAIFLFFLFWCCARVAAWLAARFAGRWGLDSLVGNENPLAARAGFVVLLLTISVASFLTDPFSNAFSRYFEHEADVYGQEAIHGIVADPRQTAVSAFNHLGEAWLEDPNPSPILEFWLYSHPSVQHRAEFALRYDPWKAGGTGKFFQR